MVMCADATDDCPHQDKQIPDALRSRLIQWSILIGSRMAIFVRSMVSLYRLFD